MTARAGTQGGGPGPRGGRCGVQKKIKNIIDIAKGARGGGGGGGDGVNTPTQPRTRLAVMKNDELWEHEC